MGEDNSIFRGRWGRWDKMIPGSPPKAKSAPEGAEASWGCFRAHASGPGFAQCYWGDQMPFLPRGAHITMGRCEWNTYFPFFFPSLTTLNLQNTFQIHPLLPSPSPPGVPAGISFAWAPADAPLQVPTFRSCQPSGREPYDQSSYHSFLCTEPSSGACHTKKSKFVPRSCSWLPH